jgi:hypothetical protein
VHNTESFKTFKSSKPQKKKKVQTAAKLSKPQTAACGLLVLKVLILSAGSISGS